MADDEFYYLQPGFDLASLTVPRLRSILVSHDVSYPSSAKKQDLITIVQQQVVPQTKKLLTAQARIRRSSKGIENVASSQEEEMPPPPPPPPKTPRSRKSRSDEKVTPRTTRKSRTPSTRRSVRKLETAEPSAVAGESPFTDENPFQSGSSPPSEVRPAPKTRKSDIHNTVIKSETYENIGVDSSGVETTEEFTAEEGRQLQHELASNKQLVRTRNSGSTRRKTTKAPLAVLIAVFGLIAGWYRQEKIAIGYCGVGQPNWSLIDNPNIPAWAHENLQPQCEPCPPHAFCSPQMQVVCEDDFVLQSHPLSFYGLIPLPPTCEPDSEKDRRVKAVADRAVEELREQRAAYECGLETNIAVEEKTLGQKVGQLRRKGMSSDEFDDLWRGALGDLAERDEVQVLHDRDQIFFSSTSLARLPFACAVRRSFVRSISRNRIPLAVLALGLTVLVYARQRLVAYNHAKAQTPSLVAMTLDRLATQAALKETQQAQESFISVSQLRDDVLRNVFDSRERERAWDRVRKIVEGNSNVRAATREGSRTGEWSRVWEWIGPVDLALGANNPQTRKWDEGRPVY